MSTTRSSIKHDVAMYGPLSVIARVRWAPSTAAVQTITESVGVKNVTRSGTGVYSVNLLPGMKAVQASIHPIDNGITLYQWPEVTAVSSTAGTVAVRLRNQAFASVTSAPSASDTIDQLEVLVWGRIAS
jgi:hypothetical protein